MTSRRVFANVIFIISAVTAVSAQDFRNRELIPAFNLTRAQMPVEIVSIKLNGREVAAGEKIIGNDDWLKGASFTVRNISNKPIALITLILRFEPTEGPIRVVGFGLSYGVDYSRGEPRGGSSPLPILPDQTVDLVLTEQRYPNYLQILSVGGIKLGFDKVRYYVERVCFEDDTNIIWEGGYLKRRDPTCIGKFDIVEPYKLPTRR